jgi:hypothetical protein
MEDGRGGGGGKLKECKPVYNRDICTLLFMVALFTIAKLSTQPIN